MDLTQGQVTALRNLVRKQAGHSVDWINIGDARKLTDLGLAQRSQEGWSVTPAGISALSEWERRHPAPNSRPAG